MSAVVDILTLVLRVWICGAFVVLVVMEVKRRRSGS